MSLRLRGRWLQQFLRRERGQTIIEYALILVFFSIALIAAQHFFRGGLTDFYQYLTDSLLGLT